MPCFSTALTHLQSLITRLTAKKQPLSGLDLGDDDVTTQPMTMLDGNSANVIPDSAVDTMVCWGFWKRKTRGFDRKL